MIAILKRINFCFNSRSDSDIQILVMGYEKIFAMIKIPGNMGLLRCNVRCLSERLVKKRLMHLRSIKFWIILKNKS